MSFEEIINARPVRTFLLQGSEAQYNTLLAEATVHNAVMYSLSVPRFLKEHASALASFINEGIGTERFCLLFFSVFTADAAQVLLKPLEEPDFNTTIVLMTPYPYTVPATIRSRVTLINTINTVASSEFVITTRSLMLDFVKNEFGSESQEDAGQRRARGVRFLDALEAHVKDDVEKVAVVYEAKRMIFRANMTTKYALDYAITMAL